MTSYLTAPLSGEAPRPFEELVGEALNALPSTFPRDITQVMVALDIDGTILSPSGASAQVVESIAALNRAGAQVVIATGRSMGAVLPVLPLLGFRRGWIVASNGAILARVHEAGYEIVHRHEFSPAEVIDEALTALPHARFGAEDRNLRLISTGFPEGEIVEDTELVSVDELKAMRTPKLVI
ncbi:MAG: HAD family phosphatase, partial [Trueperella pyogenes]|nr:HAD family phosphatase [Trueperella pyogenes]